VCAQLVVPPSAPDVSVDAVVDEALLVDDNNESNDFIDFDDGGDSPDVSDEQRALLASFKSARRGEASRVADRQALSQRRAATRDEAHKGNQQAARGLDNATYMSALVAMVAGQHRREDAEAEAACQHAAVRAAVGATEAQAEASRQKADADLEAATAAEQAH
jgi:hypothetical protein